MSTTSPARLVLLVALFFAASGLRAEFTAAPDRDTGSYRAGETVTWTIKDSERSSGPLRYTIKRDGAAVVKEGVVELDHGAATLSATHPGPGVLLAELFRPDDRAKPLAAAGGIFSPEAITPAAPEPANFDAFWQAKLAELARVPMNPRLEKIEGLPDSDGIDYHLLTLDNIRGTRIHGQLARPAAPGKLPAIVLFQYAGVYPLPPYNVLSEARSGWLALNINAHDLPLDESAAFYEERKNGALRDYIHLGDEDRETSYFLRMYLGCARAVDYLASRPDWDGRTLLVSGVSQGGLQAFVAAGLNPKVTGLMALVPAGCDNLAPRAGRAVGWPFWLDKNRAGDRDWDKIAATAGYYDGVFFAARAKCPALVSYGLIDTVSRPTGIAAAINSLAGPREALILPLSDHRGNRGVLQKPHWDRASLWKNAAAKGEALPPP